MPFETQKEMKNNKNKNGNASIPGDSENSASLILGASMKTYLHKPR